MAHFASTSDPKLTERFLLTHADVLDASVWYDDGELHAHVTCHDATNLTPRDLRTLCACELGIQHTPNRFIFVSARSRAA